MYAHMCVCTRSQLSGLQLQLSPWGKVSFVQSPPTTQVVTSVISCLCQCCRLAPLLVPVAPVEGPSPG